MTDSADDLEHLRAELDRIDRELIERAAERQRVVAEIGRVKGAVGRQLRDFRREREVLDGVRDHASSLGLDPEVAEALLSTLIEASLTRQESQRITLAARGQGQRALVIGGAGRLGDWLVRFLDSQGYVPIVADPALDRESGGGYSDWRQAPLDVELIVIAAPIEASRSILEALIEKSPAALVFDVASVKAPLVDALHRAAAAGLKVCSIHPMFGPDTRLLAGRHVLLMDCGHAAALAEARALFADTMAELVELDLAEHDRLMAWVLGLSHALNLVFAATLAGAEIPAERLAEISSTTFGRQLRIAAAVVAENPRLYFEIQRLNPNQRGVVEGLRRVLDELDSALRKGDEAGFVTLMQRGRRWADRHRDAAGPEAARQ
jgi:chorismate mutase/prephenate dehydrogenase